MAKKFEQLNDDHINFINAQKVFFVGTAGAEGSVNISPKGIDSFRVLGLRKVLWLNLTGSGNETAAHILENSRMTIMFCSFDKQPLILRLYGSAKVFHPRDGEWETLYRHFDDNVGARQIFEMDVKLVQTSCGFAVPVYEFVAERQTLNNWAEKQGRAGIEEYWQSKNRLSIDNKDTGTVL